MARTREQELRAPASPTRDEAPAPPPARPRYEPPRVLKKRSLSRATLFTGTGPDGPGAEGPGLLANG